MWYTSQVIDRNMKFNFLDVHARLHYTSAISPPSAVYHDTLPFINTFVVVGYKKVKDQSIIHVLQLLSLVKRHMYMA